MSGRPGVPARAVVFAYHDVGVRCLQVLLAGGVEVALVLTHADDAAERIWFQSVAALCRERGIDYLLCDDVNDPALLERVRALAPDLLFSFYFRRMLPAALIALAPAFNMHGSLLPQFRGRAPVNWAVLHGAHQTGATLHAMTERPDAGPIVAQSAVPILPDDTAPEVFSKVTVAAETTLWRALPGLLDGSAPRLPNRLAEGSYFGARSPDDGRIDWNADAQAVYNLVRAVAPPYPGAFTELGGCRLVVARARLAPGRWAAGHAPGLAVAGAGIFGVCGDGRALAISRLTGPDGDLTASALIPLLDSPP